MADFFKRLLHRTVQKVNRAAAGSAVPAGLEPGGPQGPTAHERTLIRRRLRALDRRREALTHDNGASGSPDELGSLDAETAALAQALDERGTLEELFASGVSARCQSCGELTAPREHFCSNCGAQQGDAVETEEPHPPAPRSAHPASAPTAVITGASSARPSTPPAR